MITKRKRTGERIRLRRGRKKQNQYVLPENFS